MIAAVTHAIKERAMAIAIWAAALSSGAFFATLIGGLSGGHGSSRTAFVIVAIVGVVAASLSQTAPPATPVLQAAGHWISAGR